jgi:hypothetical protein
VRSSYVFLTSEQENARYYGDIVLACQIETYCPLFISGENLGGLSPRMFADKVMVEDFENEQEHDCIIISNCLDGIVHSTIFVVFDSEQIKILGEIS